MKYCIHCGEEIADSAKFCSACGKSQETEDYRFDRVRPVSNQQIRSDNHKGHINNMSQNEQPPKPPKKDFSSNSGAGGKDYSEMIEGAFEKIVSVGSQINREVVKQVKKVQENTEKARQEKINEAVKEKIQNEEINYDEKISPNENKNGGLLKCPMCGDMVDPMDAVCPSCGYVFKEKATNQSIDRFITNLNKLDRKIANTPNKKKSNAFGDFLLLLFWYEKKPDLNSAEKEKASYIDNYVFSNDKESLTEAMITIESKIDSLKDEQKGRYTSFWLTVWKNKADEVYSKSKIVIPEDSKVEEVYKNICKDYGQMKKHYNMRRLIALIVALTIIILPYFSMFKGHGGNDKIQNNSWDEIKLAERLPEINNKMEIYSNDETSFYADIKNYSYNHFKDYIDECKNMGYDINSKTEDGFYSAYNSENYFLQLTWNEAYSKNESDGMSVELQVPRGISEDFEWPVSGLGEEIPMMNDKTGSIESNSADYLSFYVSNVTQKEFDSYISECKSSGYTIDVDESSKSFDGFKENGTKISIYLNDTKEMDVTVESAETYGEITWPQSGPAKLLPVPTSTTGKITFDDEDDFTAELSNMTIDDFNAYVEQCKNMGFTEDYYKTDTTFSAENADGWELNINYEGYNVISIDLSNY